MKMDKNMNTMSIVFIAGIVLIAVILVLNSGKVEVITNSGQDAISVSGNANLQVEPDQAEVFVRIETFNERAADAKNENAKTSDQVTKALKKVSVKDDEIETASFYLSPRYTWDPDNNKQILEGYTATNILKITTKDIEKAGKIIDVAVDNGANAIDNVRFGLTNEKQKEVSGEALIRAAQVARDKAESLANSLGVDLGKVVSVQESNFNYAVFDYAPMAEAMEASKGGVPTQIEPGKVDVTAYVSIAYEIK